MTIKKKLLVIGLITALLCTIVAFLPDSFKSKFLSSSYLSRAVAYNLRVMEIDDGSVTLAWDATTSNPGDYTIEYRPLGGTWLVYDFGEEETTTEVPTTTWYNSTPTTEVQTTTIQTLTTEVPTTTIQAPTTEVPTKTWHDSAPTTEVPTTTIQAPTTEVPTKTWHVSAPTTEVQTTTIQTLTTEVPTKTWNDSAPTTEVQTTTIQTPTTEVQTTTSNQSGSSFFGFLQSMMMTAHALTPIAPTTEVPTKTWYNSESTTEEGVQTTSQGPTTEVQTTTGYNSASTTEEGIYTTSQGPTTEVPTTTIDDSTEMSAFISGLINGTTYEFRIVTTSGRKSSNIVTATPNIYHAVTFNGTNIQVRVPTNTSLGALFPVNPVKPDFNFAGWFMGANGRGGKFINTTLITRDITVYPLWLSKSDFVIRVKTDNPGISNGTSFTIPTIGTGYNYSVDWNNDGVFDQSNITGNVTHDFAIDGLSHVDATNKTYTVRIRGLFPRIYFNNTGDNFKLLQIVQWGTNAWTSMERAFFGCKNLNGVIADIPNLSNATSIAAIFASATSFNQPIGNWNTIKITDMSNAFNAAFAFNQNIGSWNTGNVTTMNNMFGGAIAFNQDISKWNTGKVTDMGSMFNSAFAFNKNIGSWNTENVTTMNGMFLNATSFNQDISKWNTGKVKNMGVMFASATSFNQNISSWNVANLTDAYDMFDKISLSTGNYDAILKGWNTQTIKPSVIFDGGNSKYCTAEIARNKLDNAPNNWTITDGGKDCSNITITPPTTEPPTTTIPPSNTIEDPSISQTIEESTTTYPPSTTEIQPTTEPPTTTILEPTISLTARNFYSTTPSKPVSLIYTARTNDIGTAECRLLSYDQSNINTYSTNHITVTAPITPGIYAYYINCRNTLNPDANVLSNPILITVNPVSNITVSLSATPQGPIILPANTTRLTWTTTGNPEECTASNGWSGTKSATGASEERTGLTAGSHIFTLTCSKVGTASVSASVQLDVRNTYTITFEKNHTDTTGATGTMNSQAIVSRASANLASNTYTRSGYSFAGWATSPTGAVVYANNASYTMGTANVILYAMWTPTATPTIISITSSKMNGTYKEGVTIPISVKFSESVVVTGTPKITLETGTTDRIANYSSGTGTDTLIFDYIISTGDTSTALEIKSLNLTAEHNVKNRAGQSASMTFPSLLDRTLNTIIDTAVPNTPAAAPTIAGGTTNGLPTVTVQCTEVNSTITLYSGATVLATKACTAIGSTTITPTTALGNGTYSLSYSEKDIATNESGKSPTANITIALANTTTRTSITTTTLIVTGTTNVGRALFASFSPIGPTATYQWQKSDSATGLYTNITGATEASYTFVATDLDKYFKVIATGTGNYTGSITSNASSKIGAALDTTAPTVLNVTSQTSDGTYKFGTTLPITLEFSEPVVVVGIPTLKLETGVADTVANYVSGSGTKMLSFSYIIAESDASTDLNYITESTTDKAINLPTGASIRDSSDNNASLVLPTDSKSLSGNKNFVIDNTKPVTPIRPTVVNKTGITSTASGSFSDITDNREVSFTVSCLVGGNVILYNDVQTLTTTPCTSTSMNIPVTLGQPAGLYDISYTVSNKAGTYSARSPSVMVVKKDSTVNTVPGTPDLLSQYDYGKSNTDNLTSETQPRFTLTCVSGSTVNLYDNTALIGTASCMASTAQISPVQPLSSGVHVLTAKQSINDTTSAASGALNLTVDTAPLTVTLARAAEQSESTSTSTIKFTTTFSRSINNASFICSDITVVNGTCTNITVLSGNTYTVTISATTPGVVKANLSQGKVQTNAGNLNAEATGENTVTYSALNSTQNTVSINGQCGTIKEFYASRPTAESLNANKLCLKGSVVRVVYDKVGKKWDYTCRGENGGTNSVCSVTLSKPLNSAPVEDNSCQLKSGAELSLSSCTMGSRNDMFSFHKYLSCLNVVSQKTSCKAAGCNDNAKRQEFIYIADRIRGIPLGDTEYKCQKLFNDTIKGVGKWVCEAAEKAQIAGLISNKNASFRPLDTLTRAEAYAIALKSVCIEPDTASKNWQTNIINTAKEYKFTTRTVANFEPKRPISRGEIYALAVNMIEWKQKNPNKCGVLPDELICKI